MAGPDFYKILGVSRTASPDEIKSVHRELVKKYHPDLFRSATHKTQANKKLQQINEAYAILSNAERRRQYDSRYFQRTTVVKPAAPTSNSRSTATFRRPPAIITWKNIARRANENWQRITKAYRNLSKAGRDYYRDLSRKARIAKQAAATQSTFSSGQSRPAVVMFWNFVRRGTRWISVKMTAGILGIMVLVLILQAVWKEPEITVEWTLLQGTVVDPPRDDPGLKSGKMNWTPLGYHSSKAQCAESLKQRVAVDERGGSKVFLDERTGTIAMTIYGKTEAALTEEFLREKLKQGNLSGVDPQVLEQQARDEAQEFVKKNGLNQRVNHYQCREGQFVGPESWLRSKLRRLGLVS
jgi:hypothetical protein